MADIYPMRGVVSRSRRGRSTSRLIFISMSMRVVSDRKTTIFCVSAMAPSRLASFRVLRRCEEGGDTWNHKHELKGEHAESAFVHVSWLLTNTSTVDFLTRYPI